MSGFSDLRLNKAAELDSGRMFLRSSPLGREPETVETAAMSDKALNVIITCCVVRGRIKSETARELSGPSPIFVPFPYCE